MQPGENRRLGAVYEKRAADYLREKGYRILEQNFYTRFGEIDLIARDGRYLVFVEVKYRATDQKGHPLEAVGLSKQKRIRKAAWYYLVSRKMGEEVPCRFDVIAILKDEIFHVEDAF